MLQGAQRRRVNGMLAMPTYDRRICLQKYAAGAQPARARNPTDAAARAALHRPRIGFTAACVHARARNRSLPRSSAAHACASPRDTRRCAHRPDLVQRPANPPSAPPAGGAGAGGGGAGAACGGGGAAGPAARVLASQHSEGVRARETRAIQAEVDRRRGDRQTGK